MSIEILVFMAAVCVLSGFAHGALGFGFPLVATPVAALAVDMKSAIAVLAPVTLVLVDISVLRGGRLLELIREFWYLPLAIAIGAWLGTRSLLAAPPEPFTLVLALVERLRLPFGVGFAFVAGIFEAIANVAGPMLLVYFMLLGAAPGQIVQTLNLCFSVGKGTQVATLAASGALGAPTWLAVAGLSVPALAGLAGGMRVRSRIDADTYRRWLRKALGVMAALLLVQFARSAAAAETLFGAIDQHQEQAALELVERGQADLGARTSEGDTALHRAVEIGLRRLLEVLLARGADAHARTKNGEAALHLAALHPEPIFADILLAAGADPRARNADGETPLHWAALSGHIVVAQRLIARGADPKLRTAKGLTARDYARREGHAEIARLLERFDQ